MKCRHLGEADEAYQINAVTGKETPITVHLCLFVENEPGRFVDAPRWLVNAVYGRAIDVKRDCSGCPSYSTTQDKLNEAYPEYRAMIAQAGKEGEGK